MSSILQAVADRRPLVELALETSTASRHGRDRLQTRKIVPFVKQRQAFTVHSNHCGVFSPGTHCYGVYTDPLENQLFSSDGLQTDDRSTRN